jgi:hypothetical protein
MKTTLKLLPLGVALLGAAGCATHIKTDVVYNPAPAEKFSAFPRIELKRIALPPPYAGQEANEKALVKIQDNLSTRMSDALAKWNTAPSTNAAARTLVIEPVISEIKFINATARVWAGPMAGSSAVVLKVRIIEKETGRTIAEPVFFSRAAAWGGAATFGTTDNLMLTRVANRLSDYLLANYDRAVGGPSGAEPENSK